MVIVHWDAAFALINRPHVPQLKYFDVSCTKETGDDFIIDMDLPSLFNHAALASQNDNQALSYRDNYTIMPDTAYQWYNLHYS